MNVHVIGTAITDFGELWERSLEDLLRAASHDAIQDARLDPSEIEAVFVSNMTAGMLEGQAHLGALVSSFWPHHPPAMRIEGACASGGLALLAAEAALRSGQYQTVLVVGAEKMTDVPVGMATTALAGAAHVRQEYGATFPGLYALMARAHMASYDTQRQHLSAVSVQNHVHALSNPHAQYQKRITAEMVESSPLVADPLRVLDCSPLSDGAAAVVLSTQSNKRSIEILGAGHGMDTLTLADRASFTSLQATKRAAEQAFTQAGMTQEDIQLAEVHDCFTIAELIALEDLGWYRAGEAGEAILQGDTTYGGTRVINPSGGLKASGHPVGATGVKQVAFLTNLLREGEYELALTHNVGGSGATAVIHILKGTR